MDQRRESSLEEFLRRPNPFIESIEAPGLPDDEKKKKERRENRNANTRGRSYDHPRVTKKWEEFNLEAFNSVYSEPLQRVLTQVAQFNDYPTKLDFPLSKILNEDCLETLLIKSNHSIICEALGVAQSHIQGRNNDDNIYVSISDYSILLLM